MVGVGRLAKSRCGHTIYGHGIRCGEDGDRGDDNSDGDRDGDDEGDPILAESWKGDWHRLCNNPTSFQAPSSPRSSPPKPSPPSISPPTPSPPPPSLIFSLSGLPILWNPANLDGRTWSKFGEH